MAQALLNEKMQRVYSTAVAHLLAVGAHPEHVKRSDIGYFMSIENILGYFDCDPTNWYLKEFHNGEKLSFTDLSKEDRQKILSVIEELKAPAISVRHLEEKCLVCYRLGLEFNDKILARKEAA